MSLSVLSAFHAYSASSARPPSSPALAMMSLFDQIDTEKSGSITKSQFERASQKLQAIPPFAASSATAIWAELDSAGTGLVSKEEFTEGMLATMKKLRAGQGPSNPPTATGIDPEMSLLDEMESASHTGPQQQQSPESFVRSESTQPLQNPYGGIGSIFTAYA